MSQQDQQPLEVLPGLQNGVMAITEVQNVLHLELMARVHKERVRAADLAEAIGVSHWRVEGFFSQPSRDLSLENLVLALSVLGVKPAELGAILNRALAGLNPWEPPTPSTAGACHCGEPFNREDVDGRVHCVNKHYQKPLCQHRDEMKCSSCWNYDEDKPV